MHCYRKIQDDLFWVGANDRRLAMFEGVYSVPAGVSYNSYVLLDEKTVLFDTVDKAVSGRFFENLAAVLQERALDYIFVHHMEPDHSATLREVVEKYPAAKIVCNAATKKMMEQFFPFDVACRWVEAKEGEVFSTGRHNFCFVKAPMVHWPEVMVSFDTTDGILFSADAFGTFGALNGALYADEVNFDRDYLDEARRYYCNIVGKYGTQVTSLLTKAAMLDIKMICPLHGFVWRKDIGYYVNKYLHWGSYTPEQTGVMIAYASVYGNTENAAEILAVRLREQGVPVVMFDVSVTPASEIVAAAFQYSHLVFASTTYNAGIFVTMEALLSDLAAHNLQNRTVALIENGSWAPTAGSLMQKMLSGCKNLTFLEGTVTIRSSVKEAQVDQLHALADAIAASTGKKQTEIAPATPGSVDNAAMFKLSYGLFVLTARENGKDNGCIINTAGMLTDTPKRIQIAVNKQNYTHDMILRTGMFNVSVLTEEVPFAMFQQFGFCSGRDTDKFEKVSYHDRTANGLRYIPEYTNAVISGKVISAADYGTHTLFVAEVTEAKTLSNAPSVTYQYYFDHIKPKPAPAAEKKTGWVCKICGYVYEGEELPEDFICPLCKHGAEDFERL
ncbi:MAG TPA: flavin reductase [Candidatus Faecousia intestinigallinarum]|nr:flavin reductase [Candidatus Faecousia intestinigallinarum]